LIEINVSLLHIAHGDVVSGKEVERDYVLSDEIDDH